MQVGSSAAKERCSRANGEVCREWKEQQVLAGDRRRNSRGRRRRRGLVGGAGAHAVRCGSARRVLARRDVLAGWQLPSPQPASGDAKPALAATATVGKADPFAALNCQSRQFRDSLALAVTFTQPVDAKAELEGFLQVTDTGSSSGKADQDNESAASAGDKPMSVKSGDAAPKGKIVKGSWVVGDNPRMIYFPMCSRSARTPSPCAPVCPASRRQRWSPRRIAR